MWRPRLQQFQEAKPLKDTGLNTSSILMISKSVLRLLPMLLFLFLFCLFCFTLSFGLLISFDLRFFLLWASILFLFKLSLFHSENQHQRNFLSEALRLFIMLHQLHGHLSLPNLILLSLVFCPYVTGLPIYPFRTLS